MTAIDTDAAYGLAPGHRLQWEEAQACWVVLYPEGLVRLNDSAAEILRRCDGATPLGTVITDLEQAFGAQDLTGDVLQLVAAACAEGWLRRVAAAGG